MDAKVTLLIKGCYIPVRIVHILTEGDTHPIVAPTAHTSGMSPEAWALFVESVSSPIMLLVTPMFPLSRPAMQRLLEGSATVDCEGILEYLTTRPLKVLERPNPVMDIASPAIP